MFNIVRSHPFQLIISLDIHVSNQRIGIRLTYNSYNMLFFFFIID
jgi:hypothetical protein